MRSAILKFLLVALLTLIVVWLLVGKPDRQAELNTLRQELAAEADLRSQALSFAMENYLQATVLLARTDIVTTIVNSAIDEDILDRLFYLQAISAVSSVHVLRKHSEELIPEFKTPDSDPGSSAWSNGIALAFQGSLGRAFYINDDARPIYSYFTPIPSSTSEVEAILIVQIDLGNIKDSWKLSRSHISLQGINGTTWFDNDLVLPEQSVSIQRPNTVLGAILKVSSAQPGLLGEWTLRSVIIFLLFLLVGVLTFSLFERRRFLAQLSEQQATEAQRLEDEVALRSAELEKIQKRLSMSEKLALLGQMSASISHEVNQPLAAIKNYAVSAQRLNNKNESERLQSNLRQIELLCDRVARIIVNLRSFAASDSSPVKALNIDTIVSEAVEEFHDRFPQAIQNGELHVLCQDAVALAGRVRLLQVLGNLLTNAWFACRDQPSPRLTVSITCLTDKLEILIEDNGPGIDTDLTTHIFDAFITRRSESSGLGLGLTISKSFVESMGGELKIAYSGPEGTGFKIMLEPA